MDRHSYSKNLAAVAAIFLLILVGHAVAPAEFGRTRMTCPGTDDVIMFDNVEVCSMNPGMNFGCNCSRDSNRWYYVITIGLLPMIAGAIGHFLTAGPLRTRLLFMNAGVAAGLLAQGMPRMLEGGMEAATSTQMLPIVMIITCIVVTIWFNLFARMLRRGGMKAIAARQKF
jgi:hypothetical protein